MCKRQVMLTLDKELLDKIDRLLKDIGFGSRSAYINKILKDFHNDETSIKKVNYLKIADDKLAKIFRKQEDKNG